LNRAIIAYKININQFVGVFRKIDFISQEKYDLEYRSKLLFNIN